LIFLIGSLFLGTWSSLSYMAVTSQEGHVPALVDQGTAYPGATSGCVRFQPEGCPDWTGTVSGIVRNECPLSAGLRIVLEHDGAIGPGGHHRPAHASPNPGSEVTDEPVIQGATCNATVRFGCRQVPFKLPAAHNPASIAG
jgi:hypothetical protein